MKELLLHNFYRLIEIALFSSNKKAKNTHEAKREKKPENKTYVTVLKSHFPWHDNPLQIESHYIETTVVVF